MGEVITSACARLVFAGTVLFCSSGPPSVAYDPEYPIAGVVTQPDRPAGRGHTLQLPPVKVKALELGLPVHQPATLKNDDARQLFETLAPDLLVVVAYGKLLPAWLLELAALWRGEPSRISCFRAIAVRLRSNGRWQMESRKPVSAR